MDLNSDNLFVLLSFWFVTKSICLCLCVVSPCRCRHNVIVWHFVFLFSLFFLSAFVMVGFVSIFFFSLFSLFLLFLFFIFLSHYVLLFLLSQACRLNIPCIHIGCEPLTDSSQSFVPNSSLVWVLSLVSSIGNFSIWVFSWPELWLSSLNLSFIFLVMLNTMSIADFFIKGFFSSWFSFAKLEFFPVFFVEILSPSNSTQLFKLI